MKKLTFVLLALAIAGMTGQANATLIDRGGGLIYDTDLNITWLQDANYAQTSGHDADGVMTWSEAMAWADQLVYGGYDDWRLPDANYSDTGGNVAGAYRYNVTESEFGHLYYIELGNLGYIDNNGNPREVYGLKNTGPFLNLEAGSYWSGTVYNYDQSQAWLFSFWSGPWYHHSKNIPAFAWAVRDGDVAPIPEPATMFLLGSGLVGLAGFRRKFRKN